MELSLSDQPKNYEIHVSGRMSNSWSGRVNEMTITPKDEETFLVGKLVDQAALLGVLTTLYDWGYSLISVRQIPDEPQAPD